MADRKALQFFVLVVQALALVPMTGRTALDRALGGFVVLVAAGIAVHEVFHAVAATYVLLIAAFVPPLLATIEDNRRACR
jgi:hypothetical protein